MHVYSKISSGAANNIKPWLTKEKRKCDGDRFRDRGKSEREWL